MQVVWMLTSWNISLIMRASSAPSQYSPGEHLYVGLRRTRWNAQGPTRTVAYLAGHHLRDLIRSKIERVNKSGALMGHSPLPLNPPIFLASLLKECARGSDLVPTLLEIRRTPTLARFRHWAEQCEEFLASEDLAKRTRAHEAVEKLLQFFSREGHLGKRFRKECVKHGQGRCEIRCARHRGRGF
jgi:hypothetical protein